MSERPDGSVVWRVLALGYGLVAYLSFVVVLFCYVGFLANVGVPKGIDEGAVAPLAEAVAVDVGLLAAFGIQHSVMARSWFKERWTRLVPEPVERSTYVLLASAVLFAVAWWWRPLPAVVWSLDGAARWLAWGLYGLGWLIFVLASFQLSHAELFGIEQVSAYARGREPASVPFRTPGLYRYVRHPLMSGLLLAFWATPRMTVGHLLFAAGFSGYILVGVRLEERSLVDAFGDTYRQYRESVPAFLPRPGRSVESPPDETEG